MPDYEELGNRVAALESKIALMDKTDATNAMEIAELHRSSASLDTQVDAQEQALAAISAANRTREKLNTLNVFVHGLNRKLNAIACVGTGAFLIYLGHPLINDVSAVNDDIGKYLFMGGGAIIAYGLLVMTNQEEKMLNAALSLNPWKRD